MNHKQKIIKFVLVVVICGIVSALFETLLFNASSTFGNYNSTSEISYTTTTDENQTVLILNTDRQFIKKLIIDYEAPEDTNYEIKYSSPTLFGQSKEITVKDILDDSFNKTITNIGQEASNITIQYQNDSELNPLINAIHIDNSFSFNFTRFFFIFLICLLISAFIYFYRDKFRLEKMHIYFVVACTLLGSMIIIAQPASTFYSWDDQIHFQRTLSLPWPKPSHLLGESQTTDEASNSPGRDSIDSIEEQKAQNQLLNTEIPASEAKHYEATFTDAVYLPMTLGYRLSRTFNLDFATSFRIGKLFNLLLYTFLIAYSIKITKFGKRLLTIVALLPTSLFAASAYSYDPIVISGITVFMVHLLNLFNDKTSKFNFKTAAIMLIALSFACLAKAIYIPLLLLLLFLPQNKFKNPRQSHLFKTGIVILFLTISATFILPMVTGTMSGDSRSPGTSANEQIASILSHPLDYLKLLGNTAVAWFINTYINNHNFAYISILPNANLTNFTFILYFLIFFFFLIDNNHNKLNAKTRIITITTILIITALIWTALYISFTKVGLDNIIGVQNRYFIPLLFPLLICLQPTKIISKINPKITNGIAIVAPSTILLIYIYFSILVPFSF